MVEFKKRILSELAKRVNLPQAEVERMLEVPGDLARGDFAFPCFRLSKILRKPPSEIARKIAKDLGSIEGISLIENSPPALSKTVVLPILAIQSPIPIRKSK